MKLVLLAADRTALAEGRYPMPAWAILAVGAIVVIGAAVYLALRLRKGKR